MSMDLVIRDSRKCSVIMGGMTSDGKFCFMVRGAKDFHPEFARGKIHSSHFRGTNLHECSDIPSFMDLMRFVGFSFEHGKTVFDGQFLDTASAKKPITDVLEHICGTHVLMNVSQ